MRQARLSQPVDTEKVHHEAKEHFREFLSLQQERWVCLHVVYALSDDFGLTEEEIQDLLEMVFKECDEELRQRGGLEASYNC